MNMVSSTFTIRIPKEFKEKMQKYPVKWNEEVRRFIETRIRQLELAETIRSVEKRTSGRKVTMDFTELIKEDRKC